MSTPGTAILIAAFISLPLVGLRFSEGVKIFISTVNQLKFPILTIASVLGFAYIVNNSGISITIAEALANTGVLFPFFAPILGWLGVFITGSDTSANALFGKLQYATATSIGVDPVVTVAANVSGGVVGKMISPQINCRRSGCRRINRKRIVPLPLYRETQFYNVDTDLFYSVGTGIRF